MYHYKLLLLTIFSSISIAFFSQSPEGINYQAVIRSQTGQLITNQSVSIKTSITLSPSMGSSIQYSESHLITTDTLGLINIIIISSV